MRTASFPRSVSPWPAALAVAALAACAAPEAGPPPSILVITIDTLRADHLGAYGYPRPTSPHLDALAAESIVFERCLAPMATTLPSHLSLFTGTQPVEHGVLANVRHGGRRFEVRPGMRTFAEMARDRGYRTAAFVSATPVKRGTGIEAGFETFDEPAHHERVAGETLEPFYAWLDGLPGATGEAKGDEGEPAPFLVWIHLFDPHAPFVAHAGMPELAADAALESLLAARGAEATWPTAAGRRDGRSTADEVSRYDREIRHVDGQLGELRRRLAERGLWDGLAVVVAGDHGEALGQHGAAGHGDVYDDQLHTPLMLRLPGTAPRRVAEPVSLADALPTLAAALDPEGWAELLEQASGRDVLGERGRVEAVLGQRTMRHRRDLAGPAFALTGRRWKLIHQSEADDLLFDLERDPHELADLAAEEPQQVAAMRDGLLERVRALALRRGEPALAGEEEDAAAFDQERLEELRALGYLD